jgi:hypothetical protein
MIEKKGGGKEKMSSLFWFCKLDTLEAISLFTAGLFLWVRLQSFFFFHSFCFLWGIMVRRRSRRASVTTTGVRVWIVGMPCVIPEKKTSKSKTDEGKRV